MKRHTGSAVPSLTLLGLLFAAPPTLAQAQLPQIDRSYLKALEEYVATLPDDMPLSDMGSLPPEAGLEVAGDGEDIVAEPPTFSLLAALSTPYRYGINFVSLNGNIPTVPGCDQNNAGQPRSFFDHFADGFVNSGCTSPDREHRRRPV